MRHGWEGLEGFGDSLVTGGSGDETSLGMGCQWLAGLVSRVYL